MPDPAKSTVQSHNCFIFPFFLELIAIKQVSCLIMTQMICVFLKSEFDLRAGGFWELNAISCCKAFTGGGRER